jgi:hypothetical protein
MSGGQNVGRRILFTKDRKSREYLILIEKDAHKNNPDMSLVTVVAHIPFGSPGVAEMLADVISTAYNLPIETI